MQCSLKTTSELEATTCLILFAVTKEQLLFFYLAFHYTTMELNGSFIYSVVTDRHLVTLSNMWPQLISQPHILYFPDMFPEDDVLVLHGTFNGEHFTLLKQQTLAAEFFFLIHAFQFMINQ